VVLQSIANAGVLDSVRSVASAPVVSEGPSGRMWIALAAVAGLLCGAGGYAAARSYLLPKPPPVIVPVTRTQAPLDLDKPLAAIEAAMAKSTDPVIKTLLETVMAQDEGEARKTAEAWMVLKLALYRKSKEKGVDAASALKSNEAAKLTFDVEQDSGVELYNAVAAVACGQKPRVAIVPPESCGSVNAGDALKGLVSLGDFTSTAKSAPAPPVIQKPKNENKRDKTDGRQ
jgi:hypothetical protein